MGEYSGFKRKKVIKLLNWLDKQKHFSVDNGGNHQIVVKYSFWERPFPVPFKHGQINEHILKSLMKKVVATEVCTKKEFDNHLR